MTTETPIASPAADDAQALATLAELEPTPPVQSGLIFPEAHGERVQLLRRTLCLGWTENELRTFIEVCNRTGLNPFARQIYGIKRMTGYGDQRKEVLSIQTSIDGFRVVAQRTGEYRGQTQPEWCGEDAQWQNVWLAASPPAAARTGVYRAGFVEPLYAVALWSEYKQTGRDGNASGLWAKMPTVLLLKCSEAGALRKAFPQELSGLYTTEEMMQADNEPVRPQATASAARPETAPVRKPQAVAAGAPVQTPHAAAQAPVQKPQAQAPGSDEAQLAELVGIMDITKPQLQAVLGITTPELGVREWVKQPGNSYALALKLVQAYRKQQLPL